VAVFVVRHAKAGDREAWEGDDRLRPLSKSGWQQARALPDLLEDARITRILSSPYLRCLQTVEPLAERVRIKVEMTAALAEGAGPGPIFRFVRSLKGLDAVLCTHGDVMQELVERLERLGIVPASQVDQLAKGSTWVLTERRGEVAAARYLPPP
jgi:8-oxo-dGTP diphosphatase